MQTDCVGFELVEKEGWVREDGEGILLLEKSKTQENKLGKRQVLFGWRSSEDLLFVSVRVCRKVLIGIFAFQNKNISSRTDLYIDLDTSYSSLIL